MSGGVDMRGRAAGDGPGVRGCSVLSSPRARLVLRLRVNLIFCALHSCLALQLPMRQMCTYPGLMLRSVGCALPLFGTCATLTHFSLRGLLHFLQMYKVLFLHTRHKFFFPRGCFTNLSSAAARATFSAAETAAVDCGSPRKSLLTH